MRPGAFLAAGIFPACSSTEYVRRIVIRQFEQERCACGERRVGKLFDELRYLTGGEDAPHDFRTVYAKRFCLRYYSEYSLSWPYLFILKLYIRIQFDLFLHQSTIRHTVLPHIWRVANILSRTGSPAGDCVFSAPDCEFPALNVVFPVFDTKKTFSET